MNSSVSPHSALALLLAAAALTAALLLAAPGGASAASIYACKKDDGTLRLVSRSTRCRRGQRRISWGTSGRSGRRGANGTSGRNGANGQNGANGLVGARGPAGAFDVVDATGATVGQYAGFAFGVGIAAYTDGGALLIYDNNPLTVGPFQLNATLVYKQTGCGGTAYVPSLPGWPFEIPTILQTPPAPGSAMYVPTSPAMESFSYQSTRTATGCRDTSSTINAFPAAQAGIVPIVQEPVLLKPVR